MSISSTARASSGKRSKIVNRFSGKYLLSGALLVLVSMAAAVLAGDPAVRPELHVDGASVAVHEVRPDVLLSGQPTTTDWALLASHGVTTVINLRTAKELDALDRDVAAEIEAAGMRHVHLPVANIDEMTPERSTALWRMLEQHEGRVLVQCASGNRASAQFALASVLAGNVPAREALVIAKQSGLTSEGLAADLAHRLGIEDPD